jgi:hypothetical protein
VVEQQRDNLRLELAPVGAGPAVTETKSPPKNTPVTSPVSNSACASGDASASSGETKSRVPEGITRCPGRNLSVAGLGVVSVSMNMPAM